MSSPKACSVSSTATAVCEPLCGSTPIITVMTAPSSLGKWAVVGMSDCSCAIRRSRLFGTRPRREPDGRHLVRKPGGAGGRQTVSEPGRQDLSTVGTGPTKLVDTQSDGYVLFDTVIEDYSAIHQPISGLGLGSTAMNAAFILYGAFALVGAVGTSRLLGRIAATTRRPAMVTLGLHGIGSVLVGVFTLESMEMHALGFLFVLAPIAGFWIIGRRVSLHPELRTAAWALSRIAAPASIVLVAAFFASFDPGAAGEGGGIAGLTQRALILHLQVWLATLIVLAWRAKQPATQPAAA